MSKFSLSQQIEEVERELAMRARVYPGLVARRRLRQAEAEYFTGRLQQVLETLKWLHANRTHVIDELKKQRPEEQ